MGDGSLFDSAQPYIIDCGITSSKYVTIESATTQCIAFFRRGNGMEVEFAQRLAMCILGGGVAISAVNAVLKRHISDDGIALCKCGDEAQPPKEDAQAASDRAFVELRQQQVAALREDVTRLERLLQNMPNLP